MRLPLVLIAAFCAMAASSVPSGKLPLSHWTYASNVDQMRQATTRLAALEALHVARLHAPYDGGTRATLLVTSDPALKRAQVVVENGLVACHDCLILVKLDDQQASYWRADRISCGQNSCLMFGGKEGVQDDYGDGIVRQLSTARHIRIEIPFFSDSRVQYEFATDVGLSWPDGG